MLACDYPPAETWARSRHSQLTSVHEDNSDQEDHCPAELDIGAFRHLLGLYRFKMATSKSTEEGQQDFRRFPPTEGLVIAGGLQQYLIKLAQKQKLTVEQPRRGAGSSDHLTFHDLPDSLQLHIFSYVKARDLCRISSVCRHWHMLSCDDLLWQHRLQSDLPHWPVLGHNCNPDAFAECQSDLGNKECYLRCSPEVIQAHRQQTAHFQQLSGLLRSILPRRTPKLLVFGPGMESSTSGIIRRIINGVQPEFKITGLLPGQFDGVGSGMTVLLLPGGETCHMCPLYTNTKRVRDNAAPGARMQQNRMFQVNAVDEEGNQELSYELRQPFRELCRSADGFIFIVDASCSAAEVQRSRSELKAMLQEVSVDHSAPVVVLSCIAQQSDTRMPCIDVVRSLNLTQINLPWQAHDCVVEDMNGVMPALKWVIGQAQRK